MRTDDDDGTDDGQRTDSGRTDDDDDGDDGKDMTGRVDGIYNSKVSDTTLGPMF